MCVCRVCGSCVSSVCPPPLGSWSLRARFLTCHPKQKVHPPQNKYVPSPRRRQAKEGRLTLRTVPEFDDLVDVPNRAFRPRYLVPPSSDALKNERSRELPVEVLLAECGLEGEQDRRLVGRYWLELRDDRHDFVGENERRDGKERSGTELIKQNTNEPVFERGQQHPTKSCDKKLLNGGGGAGERENEREIREMMEREKKPKPMIVQECVCVVRGFDEDNTNAWVACCEQRSPWSFGVCVCSAGGGRVRTEGRLWNAILSPPLQAQLWQKGATGVGQARRRTNACDV